MPGSRLRPLGAVLIGLLFLFLTGCASKEPTTGDPPASTPGPGSGPSVSDRPSTSGAPPPSGEGGTTGGTTAPTGPLPWELIACDFAYATVPAIAEQVAAELPEGFSLFQQAGPKVMVGFEINECETGSGLDGPVTPQTYVSFWVGAVPPDGLGESGAAHFVNFDVLVQDAPRRLLMESWGLPVHDGTISSTRLPDGSFVADYELDGAGAFQIAASPGRPMPGGGGGTFDQWTKGTCGLAYWRVDYTVHQQSQSVGTVTVDPASRYADWFETPVVPGLVNYGRWDYINGRIDPPACA